MATIQEVLRSRPVLPNVEPRLTMEEIQIGDWTYPAGICLVPNAYLVHHDREIYENPYSFRPERFLEQAPGTYTWIPFGGGRRRCIGASFAMLEMKVVISELLSKRDVEATAGRYEPARRRNITVRPKYGGRVRLSMRPAVSRSPSRARPAGAAAPALR
jgi:cytochrome P450